MIIRAALLTNIPAPYRLAFFKELGTRCDLKVFFDSRSEPNRQWSVPADPGFAHAYLRGFVIARMRRRPDGIPNDRRYWQIRYEIVPALFKFRPEVVVSSEFGPRSMQAAAYCAAGGVPLIIWSEGTPHSEGWQGAIRRRIRRALVKRARGFWSNGIESSRLLQSYGAAGENVQEGMIGVSTLHLAQAVRRRLPDRDAIRAELGVAGTVFLFSGQLVPRKGVKEFLAALAPLAARGREFSVIFLGEGEQRATVEQWARDHGEFRVLVLGFLQPEHLPRVYAAADVFVMPTLDDNWSLVALEAAVAGLPQIFSRYNGATHDLLQRHAPGVAIDPFDIRSFTQALRVFLGAGSRRAPHGVTSSLIDYYGPEACADRALESLRAACRVDGRQSAIRGA
jgi:glycosyltransferase involved in cell wall biosynthesis